MNDSRKIYAQAQALAPQLTAWRREIHQQPEVGLDLSFGSAQEGYTEAVHSPRCTFNEEALPVGAACYAWCALRWLEDQAAQS